MHRCTPFASTDSEAGPTLRMRGRCARNLSICLLGAWLFAAGAVLPAGAQTTGLSFLKIGTSAAGLALGDGSTAVPMHAFATYYNPAGLAGMDANHAAVSHNIWVLDTRTYDAAVGLSGSDRSAWGFSVSAVSSGEMEARIGPSAEPDGLFQAQFANLGVSYARSVGPLRVGLTGKYLTERIGTYDASGYALDAGLQLPLAEGDLQFGLAAQHFGAMQALDERATELPRTIRGGVAVWPFRMITRLDQQPLLTAMFTLDVTHRLESGHTQVHVGTSTRLFDILTLRAGYVSNEAIRRFSFGSGIRMDALGFDYAYLPFRSGFGGSGHVLTLGYEW